MNPYYKKQRLIWMALGALVGWLVALVAVCCCWPSAPPAQPALVCEDAGAPVALPAPPVCDAAGPPAIDDDALPPFDAGPSCGTHPWCPHPKPCCTDVLDCC